MDFTDIKTMTYIGKTVAVDGIEVQIITPLPAEFYAVQFHRGNDFCREEPLMQKVPLSKYQYVLDEYLTAKDLLDNPIVIPLTEEEIQEKLVSDITLGINNLIQEELNIYNKANNMQFTDIDSVQKYLNYPNYSHYNFCKAITDWTIQLWEEAREKQEKIILGIEEYPLDSDVFLDELISFSDFKEIHQ